MPGPTPPTLSLLAWGTGKAKEILKTPDKVLKAWRDGNFSLEFREFVEAARQNHELDVKIADDSSTGRPTKRPRLTEAEGAKVETQAETAVKDAKIESRTSVTCQPCAMKPKSLQTRNLL